MLQLFCFLLRNPLHSGLWRMLPPSVRLTLTRRLLLLRLRLLHLRRLLLPHLLLQELHRGPSEQPNIPLVYIRLPPLPATSGPVGRVRLLQAGHSDRHHGPRGDPLPPPVRHHCGRDEAHAGRVCAWYCGRRRTVRLCVLRTLPSVLPARDQLHSGDKLDRQPLSRRLRGPACGLWGHFSTHPDVGVGRLCVSGIPDRAGSAASQEQGWG
mmetsp:Transcript_16803/g.37293  ORF Transcript_16803/g.37293 Transcript_16803/m.37293 type:complete len:210 (+) Transcript_16803:71-700(+)